MKQLAVAAGIAVLTLVGFFQFPGHTWVQQDTQIYAPILEHLRDPAVLRNDILVARPHVSFTIYDEVAIGLRNLTGLGFREVLAGQQIITRALGIWGLYLMATAVGLTAGPALLVAAILSLGAVVGGPSVLTFEYEPAPRGFATPLLLLAIGLIAHRRHAWAGVAASVAFLIHPPTVYPFWAVYFCLVLWPSRPEIMRGRLYALVPLLCATLLLLVASRHQAGATEAQLFFQRLAPEQEQLQRMRASYVWVSTWAREWMPHYMVLLAVAGLGYWKLRPKAPVDLRFFLVGLPIVAVLSIPVSWLLLEHMKWALIPQFQPARALVFLVLMALLIAAVAAARAAAAGRLVRAFLWLIPVFLLPTNASLVEFPSWQRAAIVVGLAALAVAALRADALKRRWAPAALTVAALAGSFAIPMLGGVRNYQDLHTPELAQLSAWARTETDQDAVFLFADAGYGAAPGIFRAEALRAIYVDWKGGGQVNYLRQLGEEWWQRWQAVNKGKFRTWNVSKYGPLGIDYMVLQSKNRLPSRTPVYQNREYLVYRLRAPRT
ncbi:MAG TPA: DUF6798 domain-containing protein [Bryobacteraceae bacterium]|nr:DUF6798 domain-containing protein [Bryobacteraceae bacterium]